MKTTTHKHFVDDQTEEYLKNRRKQKTNDYLITGGAMIASLIAIYTIYQYFEEIIMPLH